MRQHPESRFRDWSASTTPRAATDGSAGEARLDSMAARDCSDKIVPSTRGELTFLPSRRSRRAARPSTPAPEVLRRLRQGSLSPRCAPGTAVRFRVPPRAPFSTRATSRNDSTPGRKRRPPVGKWRADSDIGMFARLPLRCVRARMKEREPRSAWNCQCETGGAVLRASYSSRTTGTSSNLGVIEIRS